MLNFDICSAFPHAREDADVWMMPPKEWFQLNDGMEGMVWFMLRALYGRRTGGPNFRDWFESQLVEYVCTRGSTDPTVY